MKDEVAAPIRPLTLQFAVTLTALVYPEPETGGYSAEVPALPGCYTQGETLEEIQANLREAAEGWLGSVYDEAVARLTAEGEI
jgi:predicted RNase H-like HicB family nuclease